MKKTALFSITLLMGIPVAHITVYAMAFNRDSTAIAGLIPEAI